MSTFCSCSSLSYLTLVILPISIPAGNNPIPLVTRRSPSATLALLSSIKPLRIPSAEPSTTPISFRLPETLKVMRLDSSIMETTLAQPLPAECTLPTRPSPQTTTLPSETPLSVPTLIVKMFIQLVPSIDTTSADTISPLPLIPLKFKTLDKFFSSFSSLAERVSPVTCSFSFWFSSFSASFSS